MSVKLNWATRITIFRIFLIIPFVSCMLKTNDPALGDAGRSAMRYVAILLFLLMAISDAVDGYLARRKNQITKLGAFLDPIADKLLITSASLLLASQRGHVEDFLLPPTVVVFIIGKDLFLLIGFVIVYLITSKIHIAPVFIGKLATALQLSMVAGILIAPEVSGFLPGWIWLLRILWWSAAGTALLATLVYIRGGSRYIEAYEQNLVNKTGNNQ
ncbi:MAG: CDP-alcohol phosphatidyltransferase family protein [Phycisphaerales bacterium]|nr:MAG: CDP-alcohol phosphatidyltransferase family protein [Phycisphaerales bacterium]